MASLKNSLILATLISSGMIVGCKSKSTAAFAPLCTQDFTNAYAQLNQDAAEFTRFLNEDHGRRNSQLTRAAMELYESCQDLRVAAKSPTCISSANANASAPISTNDFSNVCEQADRYLSRNGYNKNQGSNYEQRGYENPADNSDSRRDQRQQNTERNSNRWSMKLTNPQNIRLALSRQQPMSLVNGQVVSLKQATRSISQGATACALQAARQEITAYQDLKIVSLKVLTNSKGTENILMTNEEDLKISCQKSQGISMDDVVTALQGTIEFQRR